MRAYLMTTGTAFGLVVVAHVWRVFVEGAHLVREPPFVLLTLAAAALSSWAWSLLGRSTRS
jgi:hypothetical protein